MILQIVMLLLLKKEYFLSSVIALWWSPIQVLTGSTCLQGWLQGYVIGWGGGANLTNSRRSMLRFDRLESVSVEV